MGVYDTTTADPAVQPVSKGIKESVDNIDSILNKMNADHPGDIIADILHWCDKNSEDFENLLYIGKNYYLEEKDEVLINYGA